MAPRLYPAVLEKAAKKTFAAWMPDFPDCVAAGTTQEQALEKLDARVAQAAEMLAEADKPMPDPTPMGEIEKPAAFIAFVMVKVSPPNPSERVNVYLPKNLIGKADERAASLGMSRSSFFGLALNLALSVYGATGIIGVARQAALAAKKPVSR
jgi:predicted RNase H-like HicB family nuclease